jgi:hypothetical protein
MTQDATHHGTAALTHMPREWMTLAHVSTMIPPSQKVDCNEQSELHAGRKVIFSSFGLDPLFIVMSKMASVSALGWTQVSRA